MPRTASANKAQYKYDKEHLKRIPLNVQKTYFDEMLKPAADSIGEPINTFIKTAIQERIDRMKNE